MKLHRFIVNYNLNQPRILITEKELVHQIKNVLRLKLGGFFVLANGKKEETVARIEKIDKKAIEVSLGEIVLNKNEPEIQSHLFCAVLKKENFELVVEKATEIGIKTITPIITDRTIKQRLNCERLQKIAKEAAEQSGRGIIPKINEIMTLAEAVSEAKKLEKVFVFDLRGEKNLKMGDHEKEIGGFIGPEGGFTDEELVFFNSAGFKIVNLGSLTMRAETAAIVASFLITYPS